MSVALFPPRPSMSVVYGRLLTCTSCGHDVDLIELPAPWIDPDEYVCGQCLEPIVSAETARDRMLNGTYDPRTEPVPF